MKRVKKTAEQKLKDQLVPVRLGLPFRYLLYIYICMYILLTHYNIAFVVIVVKILWGLVKSLMQEKNY